MRPNAKPGVPSPWAPLVLRAVLVGLGLALAAGSAFALAAPDGQRTLAARHKKRCPKRRVAVYVSHHGHKLGTRRHGRRVCIRRPKIPRSESARFTYAWGLFLKPLFAPNRKL